MIREEEIRGFLSDIEGWNAVIEAGGIPTEKEQNAAARVDNEIESWLRDLRELRAAAREAVETFGEAIPGVDPAIMYEGWWKGMNKAINSLKKELEERSHS